MTAVNLNRAIRGPVTSVPVVAGHGVRIVPDTVNNRFVVEADETVLWENTEGKLTKDLTFPLTLSEEITNFERVKFLYGGDSYMENAHWIEFEAVNNSPYTLYDFRCDAPPDPAIMWRLAKFHINGTSVTNTYNSTINLNTAFSGAGYNSDGYNYLVKIVGINRISST